ncbi:MAG: hypothetical protein RL757_1434 [Bacteroidota bacterium]|jgi:hypothetical protein
MIPPSIQPFLKGIVRLIPLKKNIIWSKKGLYTGGGRFSVVEAVQPPKKGRIFVKIFYI